jgi:hypothetical protein
MLSEITKLVINLPQRSDRLTILNKELKYIGSPDYKVIEGVKHENPIKGIGLAHLNCILYAKMNQLSYVLIMEDDVRFQGKEKTLHYVNECLSNLPRKWDILLGGYYNLHEKKNHNQYWDKIGEFSGLQFYIVNSIAYNKILEYDFKDHIDIWVNQNNRLNTYATKKLFATQHTGYSDNDKSFVNYDHRLKNFDLL